jgi:hypothetical protein
MFFRNLILYLSDYFVFLESIVGPLAYIRRAVAIPRLSAEGDGIKWRP